MKCQFIKNCFRNESNSHLQNKSYRKYNIIDNCYYKTSLSKTHILHYTNTSIEFIPINYLKVL